MGGWCRRGRLGRVEDEGGWAHETLDQCEFSADGAPTTSSRSVRAADGCPISSDGNRVPLWSGTLRMIVAYESRVGGSERKRKK